MALSSIVGVVVCESLCHEHRPHPDFIKGYGMLWVGLEAGMEIIARVRLDEFEEYGSWGCGVKNTGLLGPT